MALLELIRGPEDVRRLTRDQLQPLADEVRRRLIDVVSQTGGHIGAGLGVVELTVALGYCFDSPRDKIVWATPGRSSPAGTIACRRCARRVACPGSCGAARVRTTSSGPGTPGPASRRRTASPRRAISPASSSKWSPSWETVRSRAASPTRR